MKKEYVGAIGILGVILSSLAWGIVFEIAFAIRISDGTLADAFISTVEYLPVQSIICLAVASIISLLCVFIGFAKPENEGQAEEAS